MVTPGWVRTRTQPIGVEDCATLSRALSAVLFVSAFDVVSFGLAFTVLAAVFSWAYYIFFEMLWNGQTPGKRVLRLRVVDAQGLQLQFSQIAFRNLFASKMNLIVGFIMLAGMFPVAIRQTQTTTEESHGSNLAQAGAKYLERYHGGRGLLLGGVPGVAPGGRGVSSAEAHDGDHHRDDRDDEDQGAGPADGFDGVHGRTSVRNVRTAVHSCSDLALRGREPRSLGGHLGQRHGDQSRTTHDREDRERHEHRDRGERREHGDRASRAGEGDVHGSHTAIR